MKKLLCWLKHKWIYTNYKFVNTRSQPYTRVCIRCSRIENWFGMTYTRWDDSKYWLTEQEKTKQDEKYKKKQGYIEESQQLAKDIIERSRK